MRSLSDLAIQNDSPQKPVDDSQFGTAPRPSPRGAYGLLVALIASSLAAYTWPIESLPWDPFRIPTWGLWTLVSLTMFCLGLVVRWEELQELRERPSSVFLGVAVQCTWMPALAWIVVNTLGLEGDLASGVILVGCVPGAMASNVLTMKARGNVSYSISLTTVATLLSPVTVPLALTIVGGMDDAGGAFSPGKTATTLAVTVVFPVLLGFLAKQRLPLVKRGLLACAPWCASIALLWIIASVVAGNRDRLAQIDPRLLAALLAINILGYLGGLLVGRMMRMPLGMRRALSLEVGMQNAGLGTALAATLLGSDSVAQIPTAAYTFGCMLTGTLLASFWGGRQNAAEFISDAAHDGE